MSQNDKAARFAELHVKGTPLALYNAWDAGSAKAVVAAGAHAIATSSWSVAEAQGYRDGEDLPIELARQIIGRIAATVDVPVSADFEGGYTDDDAALADNVSRLVELGIVGINFEDRAVKGSGLYDTERQATRISALRRAADEAGVGLFINARTDLFLGQGNEPGATVDEAINRSKAYADAGASGFFIPGLQEEALIARICDEAALPVNVMVMDVVPDNERLAQIGVARISYGPIPYLHAMSAVQEQAARL
ncbi:isocitrate lyase/phosphoenolpyruvate mutase family protein [Mycolicibacterium sp. P9-64]|uniref:isocitrate lyase/PEP mutase family protein n=1 Tax=Mycolicibacterium sp. P9-64 TaxID=2024612 RepID=UPI0011EE8BD4|nr:isocitrate lyase/phosphoenolpyruvate mutase family protein [Mycolicibacterium sp. P9-64]KAA0079835.1 isocitrate lyase/phosphoenolpyruvate mutase family protein [Mycolicibacterium sp. P9-64]